MNFVYKYFDTKLLLRIALFSTAYFIAAFIGLKLDAVAGFASLVWAPTGIALAVIFLFGYQLWPGIFIGAFLSNLFFSAPPWVAVIIALGNTLEALAGVYFLKRFKLDTQLVKLRDIVIFIAFGVVLNTLISSSFGTLALTLGGIVDEVMRLKVWFSWWVGDMLGALIVAPAIFVWLSGKPIKFYSQNQKNEFIFWATFFTLSTFVVFFSTLPGPIRVNFLPYFIVPSVIWLTVRFNRQAVATALFILAVVSIAGTALGLGPFGKSNIEEGLFLSQFFLGVVSLSILVFGSEVNARRRAEEEIWRLNRELEQKVNDEKRLNKLMVEHIKKQNPKVKNSRRAGLDLDVN